MTPLVSDRPDQFPTVRVVTVARTHASGGEAIAMRVAQELGYGYVDDEVVIRAAEAAGVAPEVVAAAERPDVTPLLDAIEGLKPEGSAAPSPKLESVANYASLIQRVIEEIADQGQAVIVAHGAGIHLAGRADTLRVLVTGSAPVRAARVAERRDVSQAEALRLVDEADGQRNAFLMRFYGVAGERPEDYDLVLNTDLVSTAAAARAVVEIVRA